METLADSVVGTPGYMSPEQADGKLNRIGPPSDVYSLGAMLHAILVGRPPGGRPASGPTSSAARSDRVETPRTLDPAVPRALEASCLKAMAARPEGRYESARALAEDMERWLADAPVSAYRDPLPALLGRWMRRHRPVVAGVALALVAALVGLTGVVAVQASVRGRIEASLAAETTARRLADAQSALAVDAIRTYYTDVGEEVLLSQPGLEGLLGRMLEAPRRFFQELAANLQEAGLDDPDNLARLARANLDLAEVTNQAGSPAEALDIVSQTRSQYERLAEIRPEDPGPREGLAEALELTTVLLFRLGRVEEGGALLGRSLALRRAEADREGSTIETRAEVVETYASIGSNARLIGRADAADEAPGAAVSLGRSLVDEAPLASRPRRGLAVALRERGALSFSRGEVDDCMDRLLEAVSLCRSLSEDDPEDEEARFELATTLK
ncbi:protein kinase family protein [Tautonia plasticadhaerens]|uniref:Serine/threonine-protein kinase PrkC n=1 Tax=Tautonia plasticadhaerens TaxID=2527974 RepID=A0A518GZH9_9BACT|nr:hypothetical protein [Tautonia plasticadhaerens]QDV33990.1 Serine/threonine-protein kinase PrkC [Tautonia plasticadhaerens]